MLAGLDALVFDVQDVGSRYYTFVYTMLHVLEACAREGRRVVVLDRPNPLGGLAVDGNLLDPSFASFVGLHPLPVRHGMTVGELALLFREERGLDVDLTVIRMSGWRREMDFEDTGLPWVMPSPNMPTVDTAFVYPGRLPRRGHEPLRRAAARRGRSSSWARPGSIPGRWPATSSARSCRALRSAPSSSRPPSRSTRARRAAACRSTSTDRRRFPAFLAYLLLILHARRQDPRRFAWRKPPYEYERVKLPIDILCGTDRIRRAIERGTSPRDARARVAEGRGGLPPTARALPALLRGSGLGLRSHDSRPDPAALRSVESRTATTISAPPTSRLDESGSFRISAPRATATTGLT